MPPSNSCCFFESLPPSYVSSSHSYLPILTPLLLSACYLTSTWATLVGIYVHDLCASLMQVYM